MAIEHLDGTKGDLAGQCLVSTKKKLLTRLAASVKCTGDLHTPKRAVFEEASVFTGEGNALSHALVYNISRALREAMYIAFAGAVVAPFDGVVEEAVYAVAVVLIIFGSVDPSLGGNTVCAAGAVMERKALDVVAQFAEGCGSGSAGEAGTDDDDIEAEFVVAMGPGGTLPSNIFMLMYF